MNKLFDIEDGQLFGGVRNNLFKAEGSSFASSNVVSEESYENTQLIKAAKGTPQYDEWLRKYREKRGKKQEDPEGSKRSNKEDEEGEGRRKKEAAEAARKILKEGPEGYKHSVSSKEPENSSAKKEDLSKFDKFTTEQMADKLNKECNLAETIKKVAEGSGPQISKVDVNGSEVEIKVINSGNGSVYLRAIYPSGSKAYSDLVPVYSTPEEAVKELAAKISRNNSAGRIGGAAEAKHAAFKKLKKQQLVSGGPSRSFGDIKYKDSMLPSGSIPTALAVKAISLNEDLRSSIKLPSRAEFDAAKAGDKFTIGGSTFEIAEVPVGYGYIRKDLVYLDGDDRIPIRSNSDAYLYSKEATAAVLSDPELRGYVLEERFPALAVQEKAESTRAFRAEYISKTQAKVDKEANKSVSAYKQAVKEREETGFYPKISPALLDASPELKDRATRQFEAFVKQKFAENPKMKSFKAGSWGAEGYDKFLDENYGDDAVFLSVNAYRKLSQEIATTRGRIDHTYYTYSGSDITETPKPVFEREKF